MSLTQSELLRTNFDFKGQGMFDGILNPGLYVLAGSTKVGKSVIATTMANCVANGNDFLGKKMIQGKVFYFDNDNYRSEAKSRIIALGFGNNENIDYEFDESKSLREIKYTLEHCEYLDQVRLVIIDSYIGLNEIASSDDNYHDVYPIIKEFRDVIMKHNIITIILHHTKKGKERIEQDNMLGSKALSGATTGTILLNVKNEFSSYGELKFILRNHTEIIPIQRKEDSPMWVLLQDEEIGDTDIDPNVLKIIMKLVDIKEVSGTCQEVTKKFNLEINPAKLTQFLRENKEVLLSNEVTFNQKRTKQQRLITIKLIKPES